MILTLLSHQWKSFWRSRNAGSSVALQIVVGLIVVYLLVTVLGMGIALPFILKKSFPGQDIIRIFCGFILYYYAFDVVMRFTMQELPVLSTQPYLGQNIPKRKLVAFLNLRSLFHFLNLTPLFLFLPFAFMDIAKTYGAAGSAAFIISILSLTIFNNFLILYIKRRTIVSNWWLAGFFMAIVAFIVLDYFHIISMQRWSSAGFIQLLVKPVLVLAPIILALAAWFNNYRFLLTNLYLDEGMKAEKEKTSREYTWLQRLGMSGELIALEIKLILRNQRPKYVLRLCVLFMAYGFIFYTKDNLASPHMYMFLFVGIFITGIFIMNYGQFLFAWHSNFFDGLMSSNISIPTWIRSKFMLYTAVSTILFILTSLYGLIRWKLLVIQLAAWLYNIGINSVISIYLATYSYKPIDLSKSATFNFQGTGMVQWVYALVLIAAPYLVFYPLARWVDPWIGYATIGVLGLISLLLQGWWVDILTREFHKRKYLILAGFREK